MQVDTGLFLKFCSKILDQAQVKVFTTQERITVGCQYFELVLAINFSDLDNRDIESTTTQVEYCNGLIALGLVHTVSQCRSRWLVDNTLNFQTRDLTGIFSCLTLRIVEVCRYSDYRFSNRLTQVVFCSLLHLLQNFCRYLRRSHLIIVYLNPGVAVVSFNDLVWHHSDIFLYHIIFKTTTDQALDRKQSVVRVCYRLTLSRLTYQNLAIISVSDDGRGGAITLSVLDNFRIFTIQYSHTRVGGAQVDTNNFTHFNHSDFSSARSDGLKFFDLPAICVRFSQFQDQYRGI